MRAVRVLRSLAANGAGLLLALATGAAAAAGTSFTHKDWSLDCDNTGTCRASGYQSDADDQVPLSVLITRLAGPGAKVDAKVQFGSFGDDDKTPEGPVALTIAGHASGTVVDGGDFTEAQVASLVKAMAGTGAVVFRKGKAHWTLSGDGAAAVLVKMDDVQGRIGTPGALVKKGGKPESAVPGPVRPPVIQAIRAAASNRSDLPLARRVLASLGKVDDCDELTNPQTRNDPDAEPPELWRLGSGRVLVAAPCWRGAYNAGNGYWLAHDKSPYDAKLVTVQADTFDPASGELSGSSKGRGVGDCWSHSAWIWDGHDFVHAAESTTGQCKGVAAGGAWDLPTLVSDVRKPR